MVKEPWLPAVGNRVFGLLGHVVYASAARLEFLGLCWHIEMRIGQNGYKERLHQQ